MSLTYVVPDLHGRLDLLREALLRISAHAAGLPGTIIMLGDYVDKGPDSAAVVDRLLSGLADDLAPDLADGWRLVALKGNHDAMMVAALRDPANMASWIEKGGDAALKSYSGDPAAVPPAHVAVPPAHIEWLDRLPLLHLDRYRLYVHAGVYAGIPLDRQTERTLLNKRYPPGDPRGFDGLHVVHGHDNFPEGPLLYPGRSNLDTLA